jgi:hypothetical protein
MHQIFKFEKDKLFCLEKYSCATLGARCAMHGSCATLLHYSPNSWNVCLKEFCARRRLWHAHAQSVQFRCLYIV